MMRSGLNEPRRQDGGDRLLRRFGRHQQETGLVFVLHRHHPRLAQRHRQRLAGHELDAGGKFVIHDLRPAHHAEQKSAAAGRLHADQLTDGQTSAFLAERAHQPQAIGGLVVQAPILDHRPAFEMVVVVAAVIVFKAGGDAAEGAKFFALAAQFISIHAAGRLEGLVTGDVIVNDVDAGGETAGAAHRVALMAAQDAALDPARINAAQHLAAGRLRTVVAQPEPGRRIGGIALRQQGQPPLQAFPQFGGFEPARTLTSCGRKTAGVLPSRSTQSGNAGDSRVGGTARMLTLPAQRRAQRITQAC